MRITDWSDTCEEDERRTELVQPLRTDSPDDRQRRRMEIVSTGTGNGQGFVEQIDSRKHLFVGQFIIDGIISREMIYFEQSFCGRITF